MANNYDLVTRGFKILTEALAPYVAQQLNVYYKDSWWKKGVIDALTDEQMRGLPFSGDYAQLVDSLDAMRCLLLIDIHWTNIFKLKLSIDHRNWVKELKGTRNKWAHSGSGDWSTEDAWRALDTMARLLEQLDAESTEAIRELVRQVRYGTPEASTSITSIEQTPVMTSVQSDQKSMLVAPPKAGLTPWRFVIEPHPDVARGLYRQAEFAADLSQVARGSAQIEYQDPVEFFGRTYITEGMSGLLVQALRRVSGKGGEPVIQLKTAFGGGKTHSMLALYHLLRGQASVDKLPNVKSVLEKAGVSSCPKTNVAVLVGTALNPSKVRKPPKFPGISIRTLWGEMAAQLAEQVNNPKIYDIVKDADKASVPPGSETLIELLDACGPCLILIDELVAYARKIYGVPGLPAGSFEAVLTFIQELTEAARASKNSLVVASIPESDIEIGGEAGQKTLEAIEHTFGRMEAIWKPVAADEGFEIVRRRLFLNVSDRGAMEEVCRAFSEMYREGGNDFPTECKELSYLERMKSCYPIHPEVFDRLYGDWATLDRFQKTRGVLRLMAAVIHDLWVRGDNSLLIMPSSIPLDNVNVREELTRYLPEGWNSVIDKEVDGPKSITYHIDIKQPRFTRTLAARRVARTIILGSAPSVKEQNVRGLEDVRLRLGVVQPGEQVSIFNDALSHMIDQLTYLFSNNRRYWYDTRPNLRRTVEDRALQVPADEVELEIERRLKDFRDRGEFSGVHNCPASSLDVPDEQSVRLVVMLPEHTCKQSDTGNIALEKANEILMNRGTSPRMYRNMLAFVAPDHEIVGSLKTEVRRYIAWKSVVADIETLNLDALQIKEANERLKTSNDTVDLRLKEAYCWLLVPAQDGSNPITWDKIRITGGNDSHITKASRKMVSNEQLITKWSPALLRMELDRWLWKDQEYISIKKLWEYLSSYCYLPRLKDSSVLMEAIKQGLDSNEYFGYAEGVTDTGRFMSLKFNRSDAAYSANMNGYLVKPEAAMRQIEKDRDETTPSPTTGGIPYVSSKHFGGGAINEHPEHSSGTTPGSVMVPPVTTVPKDNKPRRFYATVQLDSSRIGRDAGKIAEEIIQHLVLLEGANVEVTLEISAEIPNGVPDNVVRTVTENCRTLKFKVHSFEEE